MESFSKHARENLPAGHTLKYYINEPCRNFFKHAEQDPNPDSSVELREADVAAILFLAVEDYIRFRQRGPVEAQVFQLWFIAVFPEKVTEDDLGAQSKLESARPAVNGANPFSSVDDFDRFVYPDKTLIGQSPPSFRLA